MNKIIGNKIASSLLTVVMLFLSAGNLMGQFVCINQGSPVVRTGSLTVSDPLQTGRITRDGEPSSCTGKTNSLSNSTPVRYDSHNFTNPLNQPACVTVDVDFTGCGSNTTGIAAYSNFDPANPAANVIGDLGFSTVGKGSFSFPVGANANYTIVVHEIDPNVGCANYRFTISYSTNCRQPGFDANNDRQAELALYGPNGIWRALDLQTNSVNTSQFGLTIDTPTPSDYSGDGRTDLSVFRPSEGIWYFLYSPANTFGAVRWGLSEDKPAPGDYDRDGKSDVVVWRPSSGIFYVLRSSDFSLQALRWGLSQDKPFVGDFDGDRITDFGVYRPDSNGVGIWYVQLSNFENSFFLAIQWGLPADKPAPADYDGDGITDLAVYRPSEGIWYIIQSSVKTGPPYLYIRFGLPEDIPQPADYDGDGKSDIAVYRPSSQVWYILGSSSGFKSIQFGSPGEIPTTFTGAQP